MISVRIDGKPRDNDVHTWADYLELLALVNLDRVCGHEFVLDRLCDSPEDGLSDVDDEDQEARDAQESVSDVQRRTREKVSLRLNDAYALCFWRQCAYGSEYPYEVDLNGHEVRLKKELEDGHFSYLFLLLCGNQPFIKKENKQLTDGFEKFCAHVFSNVMPHGAEVHVYGKASGTRYRGNKLKKLTDLCGDLRGRLFAKEDSFRNGDAGDSGIDLVAWHGLNDQAFNIPVSLAQCACSRDEWIKKQAEILPDFFVNHFETIPPWMPFMFIPICFRATNGLWAYSGEVKNVVLMDRLRIIKNCKNFSAVNDECKVRCLMDGIFGSEGVV